MSINKSETLAFRMKPEQRARLDALARQMGTRPSDVLRILVDNATITTVQVPVVSSMKMPVTEFKTKGAPRPKTSADDN